MIIDDDHSFTIVLDDEINLIEGEEWEKHKFWSLFQDLYGEIDYDVFYSEMDKFVLQFDRKIVTGEENDRRK